MEDLEQVYSGDRAAVLLAGPDTIHTSCEVSISDDVRQKLDDEKEAAQIAANVGGVHCPDWLCALTGR
jgi:hypothetical protein